MKTGIALLTLIGISLNASDAVFAQRAIGRDKTRSPAAMPREAPVDILTVEPITSGPTADGPQPTSTVVAPPIDIKLENLRWQALPQEIESVAISPDQRVWYLMRKPAGSPKLGQAALRQAIEREFLKPAPQLQGVHCVFFETTGNENAGKENAGSSGGKRELKRVWMLSRLSNGLLLGYDGKQWIERRSKRAMFLQNFGFSRSYFQLNDGVAFIDTAGCHVLRADKWIYRSFPENNHISVNAGSAWLDPDGKGLAVLATDGHHSGLWHYRDGAWKDAPWPGPSLSDAPVRFGDNFYIVSNRILAEQRQAFLRHGTKPPEPTITKIDIDGTVTKMDSKATINLGDYRIPLSSEMSSDCDGTVFAHCDEAFQGARKLGPGVLVYERSGNASYVVTREESLPILGLRDRKFRVDAGKRAWQLSVLLDMESLKKIDALPAAGFTVIAAAADGSVYAHRPPHVLGELSGPVMVYRPTTVDTRPVLASEKAAPSGTYCIDGDGRIVSSDESAFRRFDGASWRPCKGVDSSKVGVRLDTYALLPGQNGWTLAFMGVRASDMKIDHGLLTTPMTDPFYALLNGPKSIPDATLKKLVTDARTEVLEAFAKPCGNRPWMAIQPQIARREKGHVVINRDLVFSDLGIVVDKNKNIWGSSLGSAFVATPKRMIDVDLPPSDTINPGLNRHVASMALAGDGEFVFFRLTDRSTYFARINADDKLDFSGGPAVDTYSAHRPLRDLQGGLWLTVDPSPGTRFKDGRKMGVAVRRMTGPEKGQDFNEVGEAELVDASGCVWLAPRKGSGADLVTIWAPSGETSTLKIPGRAASGSLVTGPTGRVFAWTSFGLQECVAKDQSKPNAYALGTLYRVDGMDLEPLGGMQYSSFGYLVGGLAELSLVSLQPGRPKHRAPAAAEQARTNDSEPATEPDAKEKPKSASTKSKHRTWKDATGKFAIEADFAGAIGGNVKLRKNDGSIIVIPMEKLSEEDQEWIHNR